VEISGVRTLGHPPGPNGHPVDSLAILLGSQNLTPWGVLNELDSKSREDYFSDGLPFDASWLMQGVCSICGLDKNEVHNNRTVGDYVCRNCYRRDLQPRVKCPLCGETRIVQMRSSAGGGVCPACYQREINLRVCDRCGKRRPVHYRKPNGRPLCSSCYEREVHEPEVCGFCAQRKPVEARTEHGGAVCPSCYSRHIKVDSCMVCGRRRTVNLRTEAGKAVCNSCYQRAYHRNKCAHCRRRRRVATRTKHGAPVCVSCYAKNRRRGGFGVAFTAGVDISPNREGNDATTGCSSRCTRFALSETHRGSSLSRRLPSRERANYRPRGGGH